ncbi:GIY-YIG nuclease family protein [Pseudomonas guariconensis]|uniref:GIY-YIG nuclease family protein n=1 Tax=Pseudomonas guariconensis TaxID=1288410 RepID=UPI002F42C057
MSNYGFVFILFCPVMPGVYMLGCSHGSPTKVAEDLSLSPGAPDDYVVAYYAEVEDPEAYLEKVMDQFEHRQFSPTRKFFSVQLIELLKAFDGDGEPLSTWDSDMATEARNPGKVGGQQPLWFEQPLHSPGYLERLRRGRE